jgi:hypothetical protein
MGSRRRILELTAAALALAGCGELQKTPEPKPRVELPSCESIKEDLSAHFDTACYVPSDQISIDFPNGLGMEVGELIATNNGYRAFGLPTSDAKPFTPTDYMLSIPLLPRDASAIGVGGFGVGLVGTSDGKIFAFSGKEPQSPGQLFNQCANGAEGAQIEHACRALAPYDDGNGVSVRSDKVSVFGSPHEIEQLETIKIEAEQCLDDVINIMGIPSQDVIPIRLVASGLGSHVMSPSYGILWDRAHTIPFSARESGCQQIALGHEIVHWAFGRLGGGTMGEGFARWTEYELRGDAKVIPISNQFLLNSTPTPLDDSPLYLRAAVDGPAAHIEIGRFNGQDAMEPLLQYTLKTGAGVKVKGYQMGDHSDTLLMVQGVEGDTVTVQFYSFATDSDRMKEGITCHPAGYQKKALWRDSESGIAYLTDPSTVPIIPYANLSEGIKGTWDEYTHTSDSAACLVREAQRLGCDPQELIARYLAHDTPMNVAPQMNKLIDVCGAKKIGDQLKENFGNLNDIANEPYTRPVVTARIE